MGRPRPRAAKTWMFLLLLGGAWAGDQSCQRTGKTLGQQEKGRCGHLRCKAVLILPV
uniref:Kallikrein-8 isoform 9 n=1 Tax=Homo sapiens TaxID=9606 RepID=A0A2H4GDB9_HUMAN|nr:kallikrein-8 isoform 9 [Homo sapiens]